MNPVSVAIEASGRDFQHYQGVSVSKPNLINSKFVYGACLSFYLLVEIYFCQLSFTSFLSALNYNMLD
jgi:bifunctional ADP-heptose synthase (sugar kinase/adenylyltransferase)